MITLGEKDKVYAVIWTTTPWTIPANQAVCFMPARDYCLVECAGSSDRLIVATDSIEELRDVLTDDLTVITVFPGKKVWKYDLL